MPNQHRPMSVDGDQDSVYDENEFEQKLKRARILLRGNVKTILSKLDKEEWISLIFLIYDETHSSHADAFRNIQDIYRDKFDKVFSAICTALANCPNFETAFDPLIEALYHLERYDILENDLQFCMEHTMAKVCENMNCLLPENVSLYQVFSRLAQEDADKLVSLRLKNWHSHIIGEPFEIKFLRNFDPKTKTYRHLITELYEALMEEEFESLAEMIKPFSWIEPRLQRVASESLSCGLGPDDYYPIPRGDDHSLCIIINIKNFMQPKDRHDELQLEVRRGSEIDKDLLAATFKLLGFSIRYLDDPDYEEFFAYFTRLRKDMDMYAKASLAICIMTHGDRADNLYLSDRKCISATTLRSLCFARSLIGKPKMFFIQACRGNDNLRPMLLQRDSVTTTSNMESDCIISEATVGNYSAMRSQSAGSWYITDLCSTLQEMGHLKPLKTVLKDTRRRLMERIDTFNGTYITMTSEDIDTTLKEIQLQRGDEEFFSEGIVDLTLMRMLEELVEWGISVFTSDEDQEWPLCGPL